MIITRHRHGPPAAPGTSRRARTAARGAAGAAILGLALAGCSATSPQSPAEDPGGEVTTVVVSLYPVEYLAGAIAGEDASVSNVVPAGAEPHDVELSPNDVFAMDAADLTVMVTGFQPAVESAAAEISGVLDLAPAVDLEERGGALDPHFWLDPARMEAATDAISSALAAADPQNASGFEDRAERVRADLGDLDQAYRDGLTECTYDTFVTGHAAFGYLAETYGLHEIAVAGIDPDTEPSPAAIAQVREEIRDLGLPAVFAEPGETKIAEVLAQELDISALVLTPLEAVDAGEDYLSLMYANLEALKEGLECR